MFQALVVAALPGQVRIPGRQLLSLASASHGGRQSQGPHVERCQVASPLSQSRSRLNVVVVVSSGDGRVTWR